MSTQLYPNTPIFVSELANKSKLSAQISTARKLLLNAVIENEKLENLGIEGFPPQKSIYLSMLKQTGIHRKKDDGWGFVELQGEMQDPYNFKPLFEICAEFIDSTRSAKRSVAELYEHLQLSPFKLKKGFLDFWVPIYLYIKSDDLALYGQNGFIPEINAEVLELLVKNPGQYTFKAFDTNGIKLALFNEYRQLLTLEETKATSKDAFIKTIVPFIKFYRDLKPFVKHTKKLSKKTLLIRNALTEATDPEKLFFEDFPIALGYDAIQIAKDPNQLKNFSIELQDCIRELRGAYDALIDQFEEIITSIWQKQLSFSEYKERLRARYSSSLKQYLLLPYQKTFYDRLCSPLNDRGAWLSSIAQATVGKTLENISDREVEQLQDRFLTLIHELDNLNDIALQAVDLTQEKVFKLEISTPGQVSNNKIIRMPLEENAHTKHVLEVISSAIKNENHHTKIAILAQMLKEEIERNGK